jgi:uncharacterized protein YbgA (DUF1722 family)/uncharacterized protein YbbK (DUF523 family)
MEKIKIGISSCLLGNKVRYDGQHKHDRYITDTLGNWFDFMPICPEVECGLPVPREAMRLVGSRENFRLLTNKTGKDITPQMTGWALKKLKDLEKEDLVAFIFKTKSPSSGLRAVKIYKEDGNVAERNGRGIFAGMFVEHFPEIPVEDEGRLHDAGIRENFIEEIFILQRWREIARDGGPRGLVDFHSRHKYTLMAHSPEKLRGLGRITAGAGAGSGADDFDKTIKSYFSLLLEALKLKKTVSKNTNVLQHIMGYFKEDLSSDEKEELLEIIRRYQGGFVPLIVPVTLLNHFVRKYDKPYLSSQFFLNPHPAELGLLNHV